MIRQRYYYQLNKLMKQGQQDNPFDILDCIDLDPSQRSSSEQMDQPHDLDPIQPAPKRQSFKNRYVNKLKETLLQHSSSPKQLLSSQEEISSMSEEASRKLRNKVAAKESRDRKKMYVQMVEQETIALEEELGRVSRELDDCREEIMKTIFAAGQRVGSSFISQINHVSRKLRKLVTEEESEDRNNEINMVVDSLSYRYAGLGKQRRLSTNECYRQIINLTMPITDRYILWASTQQCHVFTADTTHPEEDWFKETRAILGDVCGGERARETWKNIKAERGEVFRLIKKLGEARKRMEGLCSGLDDCLLSVRETFTPLQLAQFMVADESYRYREELRYHQKLWEREVEKEARPRKMHKADVPQKFQQ